MVVYKKGHKNSKGEKAEWCIVSHATHKILSSHKSKSAAEKHLGDMRKFKHMKENSEELEHAVKVLNENGYIVENEQDEEDWEFTLSKWLFNHYDFDYERSYGPTAAYKQVYERLINTFETDGYDVPSDQGEFEEKWGFEISETPPNDDWYN